MAPSQPPAAPGPAQIFTAFLWLGGTGFGGGMAGWLYREFVLKRRWIDERDFLAMFGVGQAMPGSSGVKMTVLIGQHLGGAAGATAALLGLLAAPFAIVLAIGAIYDGVGAHPTVSAMLEGVAAAVTGLTFATGLRSVTHGAANPPALAVAATTVLCVGILRWPLLPVIAALAPVSIAAALVQGHRG